MEKDERRNTSNEAPSVVLVRLLDGEEILEYILLRNFLKGHATGGEMVGVVNCF